MEIRLLRYFLEIAREGNMTRAGDMLHVSQSSLSKQMKELETELGKKLFRRGRSSVSLTDEGMLLRKRAEDILAMVDKTLEEFQGLDDVTGGDVVIGCAESFYIRYLARIIKEFQKKYPGLRYHIKSGDTAQVTEKLDRGLYDFAVIVEPPDLSKYNYLTIPEPDTWGLLMRKDHPLAEKATIHIEDLYGLPIFCSEQAAKVDLPRWCGEKVDDLNIAGTFTLFYNGAIFVYEGLGCMLTFDKLADTGENSPLCFRPIEPALETWMYVIWKKYQVFTPIAELLLQQLKQSLGSMSIVR